LSIRNSLALSYAQKYNSVLLYFVSMVVIARLMTPAEVGVFAVGAAIVELGKVLAEFGQEDYLIQKTGVTSERVRSAFGLAWLSTWLSVFLLSAGTVLFVPDEQSQLRSVVFVLATALALRPFSLVMRAMLRRDLKFGRLYAVNITKDLALVAGSIAFVYVGYSAVGLAIGILFEQLALIGWATVYHSRTGWVRPSLKNPGDLFRFGYLRTGVVGLAALGMSLSQLTISGLLGYGALGLLNRAQKIIQIFHKTIVEAMLPVLLPYLSKRVRQGQGLNEIMERKAAILSGIGWPFFAVLAILAEPVVIILLGSRWLDVVPVLRVLCLTGLALPYGAGVLNFLIMSRLLREYLPIQLVMQIMVVVIAVLGSLISIEFACLAFVAAETLKAAASTWLIHERAGLDYGALLASFRASILLTLITAIAAFAVIQLPWNAIGIGILAAAVCSLSWLGGIFLLNHPLAAEVRWVIRLGAR
jgi:O-antigen/teichoic acid export membrane protein